MTQEKSCGAVVFTRPQGTVQYVLVQSIHGHWGFPKGHMEAGETEEETALREIYEEVRLQPRLIEGFRTTETYALPHRANTLKEVVFFCAAYENQTIIPQPEELRGATLATYEEALRLLTYESAKRVLQEAHDFLHSHHQT